MAGGQCKSKHHRKITGYINMSMAFQDFYAKNVQSNLLTGDFGEVKTEGTSSRKSALDDSSAYIFHTKCCCADDIT